MWRTYKYKCRKMGVCTFIVCDVGALNLMLGIWFNLGFLLMYVYVQRRYKDLCIHMVKYTNRYTYILSLRMFIDPFELAFIIPTKCACVPYCCGSKRTCGHICDQSTARYISLLGSMNKYISIYELIVDHMDMSILCIHQARHIWEG